LSVPDALHKRVHDAVQRSTWASVTVTRNLQACPGPRGAGEADRFTYPFAADRFSYPFPLFTGGPKSKSSI